MIAKSTEVANYDVLYYNAKTFGKVFHAHCKLLMWVKPHLYAYKYSQRVTTRMHIARDYAIHVHVMYM